MEISQNIINYFSTINHNCKKTVNENIPINFVSKSSPILRIVSKLPMTVFSVFFKSH